jgi:hypothetical protein
MAETGFYYIKNWWKFQHYKHRNPPWIKLHKTVLTDPVIQSLTEIEQWRLIKLWIAAADMDGRCPVDEAYMTGRWMLYRHSNAAHLPAKLEEKGLISKEDIRGDRCSSASTKQRQITEADAHFLKEQENADIAPAQSAAPSAWPFDEIFAIKAAEEANGLSGLDEWECADCGLWHHTKPGSSKVCSYCYTDNSDLPG